MPMPKIRVATLGDKLKVLGIVDWKIGYLESRLSWLVLKGAQRLQKLFVGADPFTVGNVDSPVLLCTLAKTTVSILVLYPDSG